MDHAPHAQGVDRRLGAVTRTSLAALAALLLVSNAAAQSNPTWSQDDNYFHCVCGDRRHAVKVFKSEYRSCVEYCGRGAVRQAVPSGPSWQDLKAEQDKADALRQEEERAALKRVREATERAQFESAKAEGVRSLKGLAGSDSGLKGAGAEDSHGLKGVGGGELRLKGMSPEPDEADKPRECRMIDECGAALETQKAGLESARTGQRDLYTAIETAELGHGIDLAQDAVKNGSAAGRISIYLWKTKERAGVPRFQRDYKEAVDETLELLDKKTLGGTAKLNAKKLEKVKKRTEELTAFAKYMRALQVCSEGDPAKLTSCALDAAKRMGTIIDGLELDKATIARVKAASAAYTRYATNALSKAMDASAAASKCFKGCR